MPYFLFKCWHERLFTVERDNVVLQNAQTELTLVEITTENTELVADLRGVEYVRQFHYQLSLGDFGYYAYHEGKPIGYGWVKHPGSDDFFFEIGKGCRYLCRFFVHESMRGKRVYPFLISSLITHEEDCDTFYMAVEKGNTASERGLVKVGFRFVKEYGFWRGFKHTLNKLSLKGNGRQIDSDNLR